MDLETCKAHKKALGLNETQRMQGFKARKETKASKDVVHRLKDMSVSKWSTLKHQQGN